MRDLLLLAWATLCAFLPGLTVLGALRRFSPATVLAGAPPVTIGLLYLTSLLTGATGWRFGLASTAVVWLVVVLLAAVIGRRGTPLPLLPRLRPSAVSAIGIAATAVAMALALKTWLRGLGTLSTLPQEHDMIIHSELVAVIMRTGRGAPWQSFPADVLSGHPGSFYPNGFHLYAALVGTFAGDPIRALNAAMVVLFAAVLPVGVAGLALRLRPRSLAPVVAGAAALAGAVSYHPMVALLHDGGILSNAAAFAVAPGAVALVLAGIRAGVPGVLASALAICGVVLVHPTAIGTVGWTAGTWLVVEGLLAKDRWRLLRRELITLVAGGVAGAVLLVPYLLAAQTQAARVAAEPRDIPVRPLAEAVGIALTAPYGGYVDPTFQMVQVWIAGLAALGLVLCLWFRVNAALVGVLVVWTGLIVGFLVGSRILPVLITSDLFYNGYTRLVGALSMAQWLASGVAVAAVVMAVGRAGAALLRRTSGRWVQPAAAGVILLALVVPFLHYADVNEDVVASRYRAPEFTRVDGNDLAAARYVVHRIAPGERVMNNANDGSTYGYVFYGLPIVEVEAIGAPGPQAVYTYQLLIDFNRLGRDPQITGLVCRLHIGWAIVDSEAPLIGAPPSLFPNGLYEVAPGLENLDRTPHVSAVATFGDVTVYRVALDELGCGDRAGSSPGAATPAPSAGTPTD